MTALETKARAFAKAYPKRPPSRTRGNWDGLCGILMIQFGGYLGGAKTADIANDARPFWKVNPGGDISTASDAGDASGTLNTDQNKAPIGAFHFWSVRGIPAGHVGMDMQGAGKMIFMASSFVAAQWGDDRADIGINNWEGYTNHGAAGVTYRGWATNYSGGTVKLPGEAPVGPSKTQRQVLRTAPVRRRAHPNIDAGNPGLPPPIPAGKIIAPLGFVTGDSGTQPPGGGPWFVNSDSTYSHSSGFTDHGTHDLIDLGIPENVNDISRFTGVR